MVICCRGNAGTPTSRSILPGAFGYVRPSTNPDPTPSPPDPAPTPPILRRPLLFPLLPLLLTHHLLLRMMLLSWMKSSHHTHPTYRAAANALINGPPPVEELDLTESGISVQPYFHEKKTLGKLATKGREELCSMLLSLGFLGFVRVSSSIPSIGHSRRQANTTHIY